MKYPEYKEGGFARVIAILDSGARTRGMFYWNGGRPTFASYGSDITEDVVAWEYDHANERKAVRSDGKLR